MSKTKSKQYNQVFLESYSKEFPFIVKSRKGPNFAFCETCACDINIAHGGLSDIRAHVKTKKHCSATLSKQNCSSISTFFKNSADDDYDVINAECLFTSFIIEHNLPIAVADHAGPLFRKMFKKSEVAKRYGCGRTKTSAIVKKLADNSRGNIFEVLSKVPFSVATDGSNDTDSKLYPVVASYFDFTASEIVHALLSIPSLNGPSSGVNIGSMLVESLKEKNLSIKNCIAFGADNAPNMIGCKKGASTVLLKENKDIIVIGCLCHLLNLAAEKGAGSLPISIDEVIIDIFYYLEKSANRKEKLKEIQQLWGVETRKILKHVSTRWLSLGRSLKRVIEQWNPLLSFFKAQVNQDQSKISNSLSFYLIPKIPGPSNSNVIEEIGITDEVSSEIQESTVDEPSKKQKSTTSASMLSEKRENSTDKPPKKQKSSISAKISEKRKSSVNKPAKKIKSNPSNSSTPQAAVNVKKVNKSSSNQVLSREERLFMFLSSDVNKAFCLFLDFIIPLYEQKNIILQSNAPKVHLVKPLLSELFKELLTKFVKPTIIKSCNLLEVPFCLKENQKENQELMIGSGATEVVKNLEESDKLLFYSSIRKYFVTVCNYIITKFPLKHEVFEHAQVANISTVDARSFSDILFFTNKFPGILPSEKPKQLDQLQAEFLNFQIDELHEDILSEPRIDRQWASIGKLKAADGSLKYGTLSSVMLSILTIPHSNAECERIFSVVRKTRTEFRKSMSDSALENFLIVKSNQKNFCYEQNFDNQFLKEAKSATYSYLNNK